MIWWLLWGAAFVGLFTVAIMLARWVMGPLPIFGGRNPPDRHRCCDTQSFEVTADFDHAAGVDLELGRCESCDSWLMAVWHVGSTTYNVISQERAEYFLELQGTPELRRALEAWID